MSEIIETQKMIIAWREGDISSRDRLVSHVLPQLEQIAAARLRAEHSSSLSTHDLVNEALLRLVGEHPEVGDRAHLMCLVSRLMRNVLVDQARARKANKRQHYKVELRTNVEDDVPIADLLSLNSALLRLKAIEPDYAEIVEMRYFGGMSISDIAEVTGKSEPTIKRRWQAARAWLADAILHPLADD